MKLLVDFDVGTIKNFIFFLLKLATSQTGQVGEGEYKFSAVLGEGVRVGNHVNSKLDFKNIMLNSSGSFEIVRDRDLSGWGQVG